MIQQKHLNNFFKLFFLFTNLLFLYKYGIRQDHIPMLILITIYTLFCTLFLYLDIFEFSILKKLNFNFLYIAICLLILVLILFLTNTIDANNLKVDRWSAMHVGIKAIFNGEYPYIATDHLKGRTSNFPGLLIIGMPFYLLGNVAYLQIFVFALLSYTLYNYLEIKKAFKFIFLLIISPAYWWEILAMSDLLSNIIIVFCFILNVKKHFKKDIFKYSILLGISTCFLALTRGIVWIPLILLVFRDFWFINNVSKIKYTIAFIITFLSLVVLVIINCPNFEILKTYNPLILQTSNLPNFVHTIAILLPFFISFVIHKYKETFYSLSALLMLWPALLAFILCYIKYGFIDLIVKLKFDLSYLTLVFPFLIFTFIYTDKNAIQQ